MKMRSHVLSTLALLALASASARAEVKLNGLFCNGAVLQHGMLVPVWGTAHDGEEVTVKFQGQEVFTVAVDGRWMVKLKSPKVGGPFTLTIVGENTITLTNILVGEVWLASGQSNMAFKLNRAANTAEAIAAAADPQLRFFTVSSETADAPKTDVVGEWSQSTSETASNFSAVAYFFGRDLRRSLKVPVGLISSSVGGTPAEAWTSRAALEADPELKKIIGQYEQSVKDFAAKPPAETKETAPAAKPKVPKAKGKAAPIAGNPARSAHRPSCLYNAMIAPLEPYALRGAIWYQGEANSGRAAQYQTLFPAMIQDWRTAWGQKNFSFFFVQIAPHERMTPEIRESQLLTAQKVPGTAMAVITDIGNPTDIHPTKKEPVGARLALAARAISYGEKIEYSGPMFDSLKVKGHRAILSFTHVGGGLMAKDGELKGFTIAGADGNFVPAVAKIAGRKIEVTAASITTPVAVRYGWDFVPDVNLFNRDGLPASPFRTDRK